MTRFGRPRRRWNRCSSRGRGIRRSPAAIARELRLPVGRAIVDHSPDGELRVEVLEDVLGVVCGEKEEAKREAWLAPGVREVVDQLAVTL
ncbi:hypothetical protein Anae109_3324 [Anaeromyxobacter sp. Fw109-5]|nr:hypothetical protein Anae109_3324 [Anaeromyxobacter sp. Fw109-5]